MIFGELENVPQGDRECPDCQEETLIEKGLTEWECTKCGRVYEEGWIDDGEELEENY